MKKFLLWLLTLTIALPALARDFQYTYEGQTLTYTVLDEDAKTCSAKKSSNAPSGILEIPSIVSDGTNNFSVTVIGNNAFSYCNGLRSVIIPNSVTSIGNNAFSYCSDLTSITISNSVTSIGNSAFSSCISLTSVTIPNSVTLIGEAAFYKCSGLTSVTIPNSVTSIGDCAFEGCSGLRSVIIPNSVTSISYRTFYECSGLTSVTIPNSVTSIGISAFNGCSGLTSVTIPNSVTSIDNGAFEGCSGITSITLPTSLTSIGAFAFSSCNSLTSVTIPNSVTSIGDWAFSLCSGLTSVTIPNSVISIGYYAFQYCEGLTSVTIPNSVTSIGANAFEGCSGLAFINVDSENHHYASVDGVLFNKTQEQLILYPAKATRTVYTIPNSVTSIGEGAFYKCRGLTSVTIPNSVTSIRGYTFYNCSGLTSVTIPNSVTSIGAYAFYNCSGLTSVTIPNSVTSIWNYAFNGCYGLTSVTIPNSVTSIGGSAFNGCEKLTELYCSAVKPPVCDFSTFSYVPITTKVYVPKNSVEAYRATSHWKKFSNIIGYYVPGGENESLYIQDFYVEPGEVAYMPVRLRAERDYSDFTTDVYLPEGIEAVTAEDGNVDVQFTRDNGSHNISATTQPDGAIRVSVKSVDKALMTSNGGDELFSIRVKVNDLPNSSTLPVWFRNTSFKDADYEYLFNDANSNINNKVTTNLSDIESVTGAPVEFYNLQGQRIVSPEHGKMYIRVQGGKATKVVF